MRQTRWGAEISRNGRPRDDLEMVVHWGALSFPHCSPGLVPFILIITGGWGEVTGS